MDTPKITMESINMRVIYVRFKGTYLEFRKQSKKMIAELFSFAKKHHLVKEGTTKVMTIYHDNPFVTESKNLRTSVALTIPEDSQIELEGSIGEMRFEGKYAIVHFNLTLGEYEEAWKSVYSESLLNNGNYTLRDATPFELYVTEPPKNFKTKSLTDIYIPID